MKYYLITLLFIISSFTLVAQAEFEPKGSFNIELGLPNNVSNKAYRELMQGLAIVTPSYQYTFDNSLSLGVGLRYGYFNVNEFKNNIGLTGAAHLTGVFGKIGQEKYYGKFGLDYGVRVGYSMNFFTTNKNKELHGKPYTNDGAFVEPVLGLALTSGERSSFRLSLGYAFHNFRFNPTQVGLDEIAGFKADDYKNITTYFTIGFGYSYYFGINTQ